jgi:hypothetical protein
MRQRPFFSAVFWFSWMAASLLRADVARAERVVPETRIESPRGLALGSGVRAAAASTQAQAENPANLVLGGLYHAESFLAYDPTFRRFGWGAAVVDSMTSRLAAGFSFRTLFGENDAGRNKGWEGKLGLAFPIVDAVSVGISGRYSNLRISDPHAVPERGLTLSGEPFAEAEVDQSFRLKGFTMDAAINVRPVAGLSIAALAYNIVNRDTPLAPMMVGGSAAFSIGGITLGGDVLVDLNRHGAFDGTKLLLGGGGEYLMAGLVPLRLGYLYDQGRALHYLSGGIGYVDPRFGLQASLRQTLHGKSETSLFFALQYFAR